MKKYYPVVCIQVFASLSLQATALAQSTAKPAMMDEVVITASRIAESKKAVSANLTVIDKTDIEQSASRNIADLLAEKGIGHIQRYPGNLTSVGLRGFRTDSHGNDLQGHVLILLDGRRAGSGNLAKFLTQNVEKVEIIRGPGAVQYGSAGMGGVVNIITRQGTDNSAFIEGGGGSFDYGEGSIGGTIHEKSFDFAGSLTSRTQGDYDTGSGERYYNTGYNYQTGISANLGYSFSPENRVGLVFTRFEVDEAGNPEYLSSNDLDDTTDKENYSVDLNYNGATQSGQYLWMARYFFGKDENTWFSHSGSNPSGWDADDSSGNKTDQQGAQAQVSGLFGPATLTAGFDWLDYEVENTWTPNKTTYTNPAFFLLGKTSFFDDRLIANLGLRYDWYDVEVKEPVGRDEDQSRLTPKIGLAWMLTESLKLRAQYAQAFMMPSADQLAADYTSFGSRFLGNPDLNPETSDTYEGGLDYQQNSLKGSLTYFHTNFEDKIVTDYLTDGSSSWNNVGEATISGFEGELSYDLGEPMGWAWEIRPYLGLTVLTEYEDKDTGEDLQYISDLDLSAGIAVSDGMGTFVRFNVVHSGKQDVEDWESGIYPTPIIELDSYTVADLVASYRFLENETYGAFTVRGEVRNLFDEEYAYVNGYPMPGISFFLGLRWDY